MVDDQMEDSNLSNKTKTKNKVFILNLVLPERDITGFPLRIYNSSLTSNFNS